jgi:hypothetical protein
LFLCYCCSQPCRSAYSSKSEILKCLHKVPLQSLCTRALTSQKLVAVHDAPHPPSYSPSLLLTLPPPHPPSSSPSPSPPLGKHMTDISRHQCPSSRCVSTHELCEGRREAGFSFSCSFPRTLRSYSYFLFFTRCFFTFCLLLLLVKCSRALTAASIVRYFFFQLFAVY